MVRAVVSRVVPRIRISKATAREAAAESIRMEELALSADVPRTVDRIHTRASASCQTTSPVSSLAQAKVVLRPMGNSRRLFLLDPYLEGADMEGLAHRIQSLSKNEGINSLLIASDDQDDVASSNNCLPRYVTNRKDVNLDGAALDLDPAPHHTWYVAGGYDPLHVAARVSSDDPEYVDYVLESLTKLALAVQGAGPGTKVPVITLPHGAVADGGYALCMGPYVLATQETSFRILNPSRGLSLDPIGYSYVLPRLGWDYQQASANYPGCGMILALTGYEANSFDMVQTGLATHVASDSGVLPILEEELATMLPWNQQGLTRKPRRFYGQAASTVRDVNAQVRNKQLAYVIDQVTDLSADPSNEFPFDYAAIYEGSDASLDTDVVPWDSGFYSSPLVDMAIEFDNIFREEDSLEGLMTRLKEIASSSDDNTTDKEEHVLEMSTHSVAQNLVERMQAQSPLALRVVHQLMKMGSGRLATMENCMVREAKAQRKLMGRPDFLNWAAHVQKHGGNESNAPRFGGWQHMDVKSVLADEVDEILS
jgi:enoyl-CoA hydratase/carnithine racemase